MPQERGRLRIVNVGQAHAEKPWALAVVKPEGFTPREDVALTPDGTAALILSTPRQELAEALLESFSYEDLEEVAEEVLLLIGPTETTFIHMLAEFNLQRKLNRGKLYAEVKVDGYEVVRDRVQKFERENDLPVGGSVISRTLDEVVIDVSTAS